MSGHKDLKTCKACNFDNPGQARKCNQCGVSLDLGFFSEPYVQRWKCLKCGAVNMRENYECHGCDYKKSGCFLTTLACEVLEYEDDCYELETLRDFRESYLEGLSWGKHLLERYEEYSLLLVPLVREDYDSKRTCQFVMDKYIRVAVKCVEQQNFIKAVEIYRGMISYLAEKYNVGGTYKNEMTMVAIFGYEEIER